MKKLILSLVAGLMMMSLPVAANAGPGGTIFLSKVATFTLRYGVVGDDGRLRYSTVRLKHKPTVTNNAEFFVELDGTDFFGTGWWSDINFTRADSPAAGVTPEGAMGQITTDEEDSLVIPTLPSSHRVLAPSHFTVDVLTGDLEPDALDDDPPSYDSGSGTHVHFEGSAEMHAVLNAAGDKVNVSFARVTPNTALVYTVEDAEITSTQRAVVPSVTLPTMRAVKALAD